MCPNQLAGLLRILFAENSSRIKRGLKIVSRPHFSYNFLIKKNYFVILHELVIFHMFTSKVFNNLCFTFHA